MIANLKAAFWVTCAAMLFPFAAIFGLLNEMFTDAWRWCARRIR